MINHTSVKCGFPFCRSDYMTVLQFKGRNAHTSFVILEYDRRQRSTSYVQGGRHDVFLPRLVTSKNGPSIPPPRCQLLTVIKNLLSQHCLEKYELAQYLFFTESRNFNWKTIFSLGNDPLFLLLKSHTVFNSEIELNQILKCKFFLKVKLILFSKLYASSQFNF